MSYRTEWMLRLALVFALGVFGYVAVIEVSTMIFGLPARDYREASTIVPVIIPIVMSYLAMFGPRLPWRRRGESESVGSPKAMTISEAPEGILYAALENGCPDCGGTEFVDGPRGGMSQNISCSNDTCGARFNVTPIVGIATRI